MSGQLFAFRIARPIEPVNEEAIEMTYDPQTQMAAWQGGTDAMAVNCTDVYFGGYRKRCSSYPGYCNTYGERDYHGWKCDN